MVLSIRSPFPGPITYHQTVESTMDLALQATGSRCHPGLHGTTFVADYQTRGRGRILGREWIAPRGEALLFSTVLVRKQMSIPITLLPLAVGMAIVGTLEEWGVEPRLKWPNDVILNDRKLGGVLVIAKENSVVAGVGLNLLQKSFPSEIRAGSISLAETLSTPPNWKVILERFLDKLNDRLSTTNYKDGIEEHLYRLGEEVEVVTGIPNCDAKRIKGRIIGIGDDGSLILEEHGGKHTSIYSGELPL